MSEEEKKALEEEGEKHGLVFKAEDCLDISISLIYFLSTRVRQ
jgi:hypothetical protein